MIHYRLIAPNHDIALIISSILATRKYAATVIGHEVITTPQWLDPNDPEFLAGISQQFEARMEIVT